MRTEGLQLLGLFALAVTQPLLDLVARNTGLLVAHRLTSSAIIAYVLLLLVGLPLVFWLLEALVARAHPKSARILHLGLIAVLLGVMALANLRELALPGEALVGVSLLLGAGGAFAYARFEAMRMFVSVLAVAPIVTFAVFVNHDGVGRLLLQQNEPTAIGAKIDADAPIVLVILDALPLSSLLNLEGGIDREMFPHFASLADGATWFRNTAAASPWTLSAVPAILTGRLPSPMLDATRADHPRNLFALLGGRYEMHVDEKYTALYPEADASAGGEGLEAGPGVWVRARSFLSDLSILYIHVVSPDDINPLPPLDQVWKDFAGWKAPNLIGMAAFGQRTPDMRFKNFIQGIEAGEAGAAPRFHFLHVALPHAPFRYTASGRAYWPHDSPGLIRSNGPIRWADEEWLTVQAYQRHLMQLVHTDELMGELIDHLKQIGIYDEALIVVVADHGESFWPGEAQRAPLLTHHPEDLVSIPLFLKAPHQAEGRVSNRLVENVDVFATIADVLGIEIPWSLDGCSALSDACPEREGGKIHDIRNQAVYDFDRSLFERRATLERKHRLFGGGIYRIGPHPEILGMHLADDRLGTPVVGIRAVVKPFYFEAAARHPETFSVARIVGSIEHDAGVEMPEAIGVAVDSVVRAVVPVIPRAEEWTFSAMLPEGAYPETLDQVEIVVVSAAGGKARVARIEAHR